MVLRIIMRVRYRTDSMPNSPMFRKANAEITVFLEMLSNQRQRQITEADHGDRLCGANIVFCGGGITTPEHIFRAVAGMKSVSKNAFEIFQLAREMKQHARTYVHRHTR